MLLEPIEWKAFELKKPREKQKVVFLLRGSEWYRLGVFYSKTKDIVSPSFLVQLSEFEKELIPCENTIWASFEAYDSLYKKYLQNNR